MQFLVVIFVERDPVARDVHEEIAPVRESVVHFLDGVDDEIDRRMERLVDRQLAVEPVLDFQPVIDLFGQPLVADDDQQIEVRAIALGRVRFIDPAAAR